MSVDSDDVNQNRKSYDRASASYETERQSYPRAQRQAKNKMNVQRLIPAISNEPAGARRFSQSGAAADSENASRNSVKHGLLAANSPSP